MSLIAEQNKRLVEGKREKIIDLFEVDSSGIKTESATNNILPFKAKTSHADRKNRNRRIYPREVMAVALKSANERAKKGMFKGCCDHPWDGALAETCILWADSAMDVDGAVFSDGKLLLNTAPGKHVGAIIDAGGAIAFSTAGYGTAHQPTEDERKRFGLSENDEAIIIDEGYELSRIDAVDDPSCYDAWMTKTGGKASGSKDGNDPPPTQESAMKNLDEMKTGSPELFKLHEAAINAAVEAATKPLKEQVASLQKTVDSVNGFIGTAKDLAGITVPFKDFNKDAQAQVETAKAALTAKEAELKTATDGAATLKTEIATLTAKINEAETAKKNADRKAAVMKKCDELLASNGLAKQIKPHVEKAVEAADFDEAKMTALIAAKDAEYKAVLEGTENPLFEIEDPEKKSAGSADLKARIAAAKKEIGV